jgi:EAL domain-containing protein (putative c-di-GMP-specific phosphodiesterase class I)
MGGKVIGLAAMIRLDPRAAGEISPSELIPIAEESDLMIRIGRWVFTTCCRQIETWNNRHELEDVCLSINLSHRQLMDGGWCDFVDQTVRKHHVEPHRIEFEISEHSLVKAGKQGLHTIEKLHELGFHLSIDDFGTGYSSLADLKRYAFKRLKIDRTLVKNLSDDIHKDIVKASVAMADALGLDTLAKGVESDHQAEILTNLGCHEMQGYLYGQPLRQEEVTRKLTR